MGGCNDSTEVKIDDGVYTAFLTSLVVSSVRQRFG